MMDTPRMGPRAEEAQRAARIGLHSLAAVAAGSAGLGAVGSRILPGGKHGCDDFKQALYDAVHGGDDQSCDRVVETMREWAKKRSNVDVEDVRSVLRYTCMKR